MINKIEEKLKSTDDVTELNVVKWLPDGEIKGVIQVAHGITEHAGRYEQFANYFASKGYVVVVNDIVGHGKSISDKKNKMYFGKENSWFYIVEDFHNIYKNWGWLGGHSDGEKDQSKVALKEAKEESGIDDIKLLSSSPISIEILPVSYHIKNDKFVNSHLHFNMTYLLQANDTSELKIKPDENSGLKWVDLDDAYKYTNEECMIPIYKKLSQYVKKIKD